MNNNPIEYNDSQIASGMCNNDRSAYYKFMKKYYKLILYLCIKSCRNKEDAEELCNDIIMKIFKKIDSFDTEKGKLAAWICKIASNHLRDNMRKKDLSENEITFERYIESENNNTTFIVQEYFNKKNQENEKIDSKGVFFNKIDKEKIDKEINSNEDILQIARLKNTMEQLSERDQLIVRFRAEGFDYKEIAEFLNISYKAATTAYSRAVRKIRDEFYKKLK